MSLRAKSAVLHGILAVLLGVLWWSGSPADMPGARVHLLHLIAGFLLPIVLLFIVNQLCRPARPSLRVVVMRMLYVLLILTSISGALAWGVHLAHVAMLHVWLSRMSLVLAIPAAILMLRSFLQPRDPV